MANVPIHSQDEAGVGTIAKEITTSLKDVIRSEIKLAKAEVKETTGHVKKHGVQVAIGGGLLALGVLPLLAFLCIGLGNLLNGRYALSSLIVAVLFMGIGGLLAKSAVTKIKKRDLTLPETRGTVQEEITLMNSKVHEISSATKRRVS